MSKTWDEFIEIKNTLELLDYKCARVNDIARFEEEEESILRYEYEHSSLVYPEDIDSMVEDKLKGYDKQISDLEKEIEDIEDILAKSYDKDLVEVAKNTSYKTHLEGITVKYLEDKSVAITPEIIQKIYNRISETEKEIIAEYISEDDNCEEDITLPNPVPELMEIANNISEMENELTNEEDEIELD